MRDILEIVVAGSIPTYARQMSIRNKRLVEHQRTQESPVVKMITNSKRKLTEVSLYAALGGEVSRVQSKDARLSPENGVRVDALKQLVIPAIEDYLDSDILVTAAQNAESKNSCCRACTAGY